MILIMTGPVQKKDRYRATRLIKLIISMIVWFLDYARRIIKQILGIRPAATCVILYYHAVTREQIGRFTKQMDEVIRRAKPISADNDTTLERGVHYAALTFDDGFSTTIGNVLPVLAQRHIPVTLFVPAGYLGLKPRWDLNGAAQHPDEVVITPDQMRALNSNMVSIGSHCITHSNLLLLDENEARMEIVQSKHELESIIEKGVKTLSFPYGAFTQKHLEFARQAGYERVFSILPHLAFSRDDEFVTGRVYADPTDWPLEFRLKLSGAYRWLPLAFALKRKVRFVSDKLNKSGYMRSGYK